MSGSGEFTRNVVSHQEGSKTNKGSGVCGGGLITRFNNVREYLE